MQSNYPKDSIYYDDYIEALDIKNIKPLTVDVDYEVDLDEIKMLVNPPETEFDNNESNNSSLIVSIKFKNTSYLFTGDAQNDRIKSYLKGTVETCDFIKIPYHGAYQMQLDDLLNATRPDYAVITCSNQEPDVTETLKVLKDFKVKSYLTKNGAITVLSDGVNIKIKQ